MIRNPSAFGTSGGSIGRILDNRLCTMHVPYNVLLKIPFCEIHTAVRYMLYIRNQALVSCLVKRCQANAQHLCRFFSCEQFLHLPLYTSFPAELYRSHSKSDENDYRRQSAKLHHSPTDTAIPLNWRISQELPLKSVGGREEVSLSPYRIVAYCQPQQSWWIVPPVAHLQRICTCNYCEVIKVQRGKIPPSYTPTFFGLLSPRFLHLIYI